MPRPTADHYELSETEKRDLIKLIEEGKPLPERYRFLLFEDKREVELVWNGKTREVCTAVLPFQTLEHIDEPRAEKEGGLGVSPELFDTTGRQIKGWANKLIWGDNKLILSSLKAGALRRQIDLTTAPHTYAKPGRYTVAVKVIDIFGNDTMALIPVNVG